MMPIRRSHDHGTLFRFLNLKLFLNPASRKKIAPMKIALMAVKTTGSRPETNILFTGIAKPLTTAVSMASIVPRTSFFIRLDYRGLI